MSKIVKSVCLSLWMLWRQENQDDTPNVLDTLLLRL